MERVVLVTGKALIHVPFVISHSLLSFLILFEETCIFLTLHVTVLQSFRLQTCILLRLQGHFRNSVLSPFVQTVQSYTNHTSQVLPMSCYETCGSSVSLQKAKKKQQAPGL